MAKILTDKELGEIIHKAINDPGLIDDSDSFEHFLEDLGTLVADHFGGERGCVGCPGADDDMGWTVGFHINECVPADGGVYKDYDTDETWEDGKEYSGPDCQICRKLGHVTCGNDTENMSCFERRRRL